MLPTPLPASIEISADAVELLLENIYERNNPGVVNIDLSGGTGSALTEFGSGSGFVIDLDGHIVTNNHVVEGADETRCNVCRRYRGAGDVGRY